MNDLMRLISRLSKLLLLVLLLVLAPAALASTWYVDGVNGSDNYDCKTSLKACKTLGQAISLASVGDSIEVAQATYSENLTVSPNNNNLMIVLGATAYIVFGVFFCLVLWWLVLKIVRVLVKQREAFGKSVAIRIVALALVVWLSPQTVTAVIDAVTEFVRPFLEKAPPLVAAFAAYRTSGASSLTNFGPHLADVFVSAVTGFLSALQVPRLILSLALWVIVGSVFSAMFQQEPAPIMSRLFTRVKSVSRAAWTNIALILILAFGCYLSIAAIVAVPYLRQSAEATEQEVLKLTTRLDESRISKEVYYDRYPSDIPLPQNFSKLRETLKEKVASSTPSQTNPTSNIGSPMPIKTTADSDRDELNMFNGVLDILDNNRNNLIADYRTQRGNGFDQEISLRNTAISRFSTNGGRGQQERARYATELDIWYRTQVSKIDTKLSDCVGSVRSMDSALNLFSSLVGPILSASGGFSGISRAVEPMKELTTRPTGCTSYIAEDPPKLRPASNWGPLGAMARWLLSGQSLDIALITGMLGFGLFGAAISTFVRKQALPKNETPSTNLVGVIIRGLSAAIVVFLAALGGLAIFSNAEAGQSTEPNPYALFLTCLAAAVFSEDVWLRVHSRLREQAGSAETVDEGIQTGKDLDASDTPIDGVSTRDSNGPTHT